MRSDLPEEPTTSANVSADPVMDPLAPTPEPVVPETNGIDHTVRTLPPIPPGIIADELDESYARYLASQRKGRVLKWFDIYKDKKIPTLLRQIWKSDWTIATFIPMVICFYAMKLTGWGWLGVLYFMLSMSMIDAVLAIFVGRLSAHQSQLASYTMDDYERDWLRYRMLLTLTRAVLYFVVGLGCGWSAIVGAHFTWYFCTCERLRYAILRSEMMPKYPELERWSIFAILKGIGIFPTHRNFNIAAFLGIVLGFGITFLF